MKLKSVLCVVAISGYLFLFVSNLQSVKSYADGNKSISNSSTYQVADRFITGDAIHSPRNV